MPGWFQEIMKHCDSNENTELPQKSVTNTQVYFNKRQLLKAKSTLND
jgi:hypothetical protein